MSRFKRHVKSDLPEIPTASLPDVVFMLLFFFMVSTQFNKKPAAIELPKSKNRNTVDKGDVLQIGITSESNNYFYTIGQTKVDSNGLAALLADYKAKTTPTDSTNITIVSDINTKYGAVAFLKKALAEQGLTEVMFITNKEN